MQPSPAADLGFQYDPLVDPLFERFSLIVNGPALFNALVTGVELDVFGRLDSVPGSALEDLSRHAAVEADKMRVLMLGLCASGLVERRGAGYANSRLATHFLAERTGPDSWRDILVGWQRIYYPAFAELTTALRTGTNTALGVHPGDGTTLYKRLAHTPELEQVLHRSMSAFTMQSMPALLEHAGLGNTRHLLDAGGGDGTTTEALLGVYPQLKISIFDVPTVAGLASSRLARNPRVEVHTGDLFTDPYPQGADALLFSHVLEIFSGDEVLFLARKAFDLLPSGGRLLVYGFNATEYETGGVYSARLALYLTVLASGHGMTYPARDYEGWLRAAGFDGVHTITGLPYEHGLTTGTKP
jgi:hypothetical protein